MPRSLVVKAWLGMLAMAASCGGGGSDRVGSGGVGAVAGGGGGGAAGAKAGSGGGGGMGGAAGSAASPYEAATPTSDCTVEPGAAGGPVLVDTSLTCGPGGTFMNVAAGAADRGHIAYGEFAARARVVTIEPSGAASVVLGPDALRIDVSADGGGAVHATGVANAWDSIGFYRLDERGWWREAVAPATGQVQETRPARFTIDGRAFVAYYSFDFGPILAERATGGAWTQKVVPRRSVAFALTVDGADRPHVPYLTNGERVEPGGRIDDWFGASSPSLFWFPINDWRDSLDAAPVGDEGIAVAMLFGDGVHVFVQQADGVVVDRPLPATRALVLDGCPKPDSATPTPQSRPCTETGDGVTGHAVTAAADGLWLAYIWRHVDHDMIQTCWHDEWVTCETRTVTDRSSADVVVVRVPADGAAGSTPAVVWRTAIAETPDGPVAMDGRGARLALAVMSSRESTTLKTIRYVLLDAGAL